MLHKDVVVVVVVVLLGLSLAHSACHNLKFHTAMLDGAESSAQINLDGEPLPLLLHDSKGLTLPRRVCMPSFELEADSLDSWIFTFEVNDEFVGAGCVGLTECTSTTFRFAFPTHPNTTHTVNFTTRHSPKSESKGPIFVWGYGQLPTECHLTKGGSCVVIVTAPLLYVSTTRDDEWLFYITVDNGPPLEACVDSNVLAPGVCASPFLKKEWDSFSHSCETHLFRFNTDSLDSSESHGSIYLDGVPIPLMFHDQHGDRFEKAICASGFEITTSSTDAWVFTFEIDNEVIGAGCVDYGNPPDGCASSTFKFDLPKQPKSVHSVKFTTRYLSFADSIGPIYVWGIGELPHRCFESKGSTCTVEVDAPMLFVSTVSNDGWFFLVSVDNGPEFQACVDTDINIPSACSSSFFLERWDTLAPASCHSECIFKRLFIGYLVLCILFCVCVCGNRLVKVKPEPYEGRPSVIEISI